MFKYMYIDESGDLGLGGSRYMVLSALLVDDAAPLDRIIKNMRRNKFKNELRKAAEIKANSSSDEVRLHLLRKLNEVKGAKIFYILLEKKKLHSEFLKNNKHKLYNYVAGKLARQMVLQNLDVEIRIDRSKGKQLLQDDFNQHFQKMPAGKIILHKSYNPSQLLPFLVRFTICRHSFVVLFPEI